MSRTGNFNIDSLRGIVNSAISPVFQAFLKSSISFSQDSLKQKEATEQDGIKKAKQEASRPAKRKITGQLRKPTIPLARVETYNLQAVAYYSLGRYDKTLEFAEFALKGDESNSSAWQLRGAALLALDRDEEAAQSFQRAIKLEPDDYESWNGYGVALLKLGEPQKAAANFTRALELLPNSFEATLNRARAFAQMHQYDNADIGYEQALRIYPELSEVWLERGDLLFQADRLFDALNCYEEVFALNPSDVRNLVRRGAVLRQLDRAKDALLCYDQALKIEPRDASIWFNRAIALESMNRTTDSILSFRSALKYDPEDAETWTHLGQIYLRNFIESLQLDRPAEAKENWYEAVRCGRKGQTAEWLQDEFNYLQRAARMGHHKLVKDLIARLNGNEFVAPLNCAIDFLLTKDQEMVTSLPTHIRRKVESIIGVIRQPLPI